MNWLIIGLSEVLFGVQGTVQIMKHLIVQLPLSSCQFLSPVSSVLLSVPLSCIQCFPDLSAPSRCYCQFINSVACSGLLQLAQLIQFLSA